MKSITLTEFARTRHKEESDIDHHRELRIRLTDRTAGVDLLQLTQRLLAVNNDGIRLDVEDRCIRPLRAGTAARWRPEFILADWVARGGERHPVLTELPATLRRQVRCAVISTSELPLNSRLNFHAEVGRRLDEWGAIVPPRARAAANTVLFEAVMNAEEHGSVQLLGNTQSVRLLLAAVRTSPADRWPSSAETYLDAFTSAGHESPTQWLELIVADNGAGIGFPRFREISQNMGRALADVHAATFDEERANLQSLLNSRFSSKGRWGRILNKETAEGEGKRLIRLHLSALRAYAAVRSGRALAEFFYAKASRSADDIRSMEGYEVSSVEMPLFRGTAWHFIVPLDQQTTLPVL